MSDETWERWRDRIATVIAGALIVYGSYVDFRDGDPSMLWVLAVVGLAGGVSGRALSKILTQRGKSDDG